jgi:hypothetical protein
MLILLQLVLIAKIVVVVIFGYGVVVTNCSPLIFEIIVGCMHLLGSLSLFFTKRFTSTTNQPAQPSSLLYELLSLGREPRPYVVSPTYPIPPLTSTADALLMQEILYQNCIKITCAHKL